MNNDIVEIAFLKKPCSKTEHKDSETEKRTVAYKKSSGKHR